jgi:hypothetical protein
MFDLLWLWLAVLALSTPLVLMIAALGLQVLEERVLPDRAGPPRVPYAAKRDAPHETAGPRAAQVRDSPRAAADASAPTPRQQDRHSSGSIGQRGWLRPGGRGIRTT